MSPSELDPSAAADPAGERPPHARGLLRLILFALAVRAVVLVALAIGDPLITQLHSDPAYYDTWARALLAGEDFTGGRPFWLPPLYPWFLAGVYSALGSNLWVLFAVQTALGLATTLLLVRLTRRVAEFAGYKERDARQLGLIAGVLWTLYLPSLFFESRLLGVNLALPLCSGALLALVEGGHRLRAGRSAVLPAALCGVLLGVACLARPNVLLFAPLAAAGLVWIDLPRERRGIRIVGCLAAGALGLAIGSAPGPLANRAASGENVWVSSNGGINFWFGHNDAARGTFVAPGPEWGSIQDQRAVSLRLASEAAGHPAGEREASSYWTSRGLAWIAANPLAELKLSVRKVGACLSNFEYGIQYLPTAVRAHTPALWIAPIPFALLLLLGGIGWFELRGARGVLGGWVLAGVIGAVLYFTYSRFRLTFAIAWIPFAAAGVLPLIRFIRQQAPLPRAGFVAGAVLASLSYVKFEGNYPRRLVSHGEVDLASALIVRGELERAERILEKSLERTPTEVGAMVELARLARGRSEDALALDLLERALEVPIPYPPRERELALLLSSSRDPEVRDLDAAEELLTRWLMSYPDPSPLRARQLVLYADLQLRLGRDGSTEQARAALEQALAIDPSTPGAEELARRAANR